MQNLAEIVLLLIIIFDCMKFIWQIEIDMGRCKKCKNKHKKHTKKPPTTGTRRQLKVKLIIK